MPLRHALYVESFDRAETTVPGRTQGAWLLVAPTFALAFAEAPPRRCHAAGAAHVHIIAGSGSSKGELVGALTLAADTQWTSVLTLTPLDAEPVQGGIVSSGPLQTLVLAQALGEMGVAARCGC